MADSKFEVDKCYRIYVKGDNDNFVDAKFTEFKICDYPDDEYDENEEDIEDILPFGGSVIINDYSTYSLRIYPNKEETSKNEIEIPIKFGIQLFVFDRLEPFDPWYKGGEHMCKDNARILFDNYTVFHRSRRTRCSRSNTVQIPVEAYEHLQFFEINNN